MVGIDGVAGASGTAGTSGTSSTNATSVSVTNANATASYFYPVFVSTDGSTQTLYVDKEAGVVASLSYLPSSAVLYVGVGVGGTVLSDSINGTNSVILGALGPGMFNDTTNMAFGDFNGDGINTTLYFVLSNYFF